MWNKFNHFTTICTPDLQFSRFSPIFTKLSYQGPVIWLRPRAIGRRPRGGFFGLGLREHRQPWRSRGCGRWRGNGRGRPWARGRPRRRCREGRPLRWSTQCDPEQGSGRCQYVTDCFKIVIIIWKLILLVLPISEGNSFWLTGHIGDK